MTVFDVKINGKKITRAGIKGPGVMTTIITLVRSDDDMKGETMEISVGALSDKGKNNREFLEWSKCQLKTGDEITVKVVDAKTADLPASKKKDDPKKNLGAKKRYFKRLKKELGEK